MSNFYRLILALIVSACMAVGCQTTAPPTPLPVTPPPAPSTNTPVLAPDTSLPSTATPIPPTATSQPTAIPTPEIPRILWDKTYHKTSEDMGEDVLIADDGGFYIVGTAGLDMSGAGLSGDVYLIRTDANGEVLWEKTYGGDKADEGLSIIGTRDGNLLLCSWLPLEDGNCLLVGSRLAQRFEIYLMKVAVSASIGASLEQMPPGLTPQVFAPDVVSIQGAIDFAATFSPDGTGFYFTRRMDGERNVIHETHLVNGGWTDPVPASLASGHAAFEPHMTADSTTIYFGWFRPPPRGEKSTRDAGIWATDPTASGWSAPRYVDKGLFVSSDL